MKGHIVETKELPERMKYGLWGAAGGAAGVLAIGFLATGWLTLSSTAETMAQQRASDAVVAALAPVCIERLLREPDAAVHVAAIKDLRLWDRRGYVQERQWAPVSGDAIRDRRIVDACGALASDLNAETLEQSAEL